jgi:uncharacterized membrane protein
MYYTKNKEENKMKVNTLGVWLILSGLVVGTYDLILGLNTESWYYTILGFIVLLTTSFMVSLCANN